MTSEPSLDGEPDGRGRTLSLGVIAGLVVYAYVVVAVLQLVLLERDRPRFDSLHRSFHQWPYRVAIAVAALAGIFHTLDGLCRVLEDLRPQERARDTRIRTAVAFLTFALGVPAAAVILWPWFTGRLR